jgi:hypothetical protein
MSPSAPGAGDDLRALAFAMADGTAWGAAVSGGDGWSLAIGPSSAGSAASAGPGGSAASAEAAGSAGPGGSAADGAVEITEGADGGWRLESADGALSLLVVADDPPTPPAVDDPEPAPPVPPFVPGEGPELCRVTGTVSGQEVQSRGVRVRMAPRSAKEALGSARFVAGWFADGSAVGLIAARPRRHDQPDHDAASATLFDRERWLPVTEPRLSTTYDGSETPARVSLELWIGEGEHEYPRRMAGEASGGSSSAADGGAALKVVPLRCHSRGEEGVGVYVLATF